MNKIVSHLSAAAAGAAVAYFATYTPLRWEIDLLRAAALQSAAREAEHDRQLAAAQAVGDQLRAADWQIVLTQSYCSAAKSAAQELLKLTQAQHPSPAKPAPAAPCPAPSPAKPAPAAPKKIEPQAVAGGVDPAEMVTAHNRWRSEVGVPGLKWSGKLADVAQGWADHLAGNNCAMYHSGNGYGENIYQAGAMAWPDGRREVWSVPPRQVVNHWGDESKQRDNATGRCSGVCGHYTQVVWKDSKEVGCGMAVCGNKAQIWVCNYDPAGNVVGQKPY